MKTEATIFMLRVADQINDGVHVPGAIVVNVSEIRAGVLTSMILLHASAVLPVRVVRGQIRPMKALLDRYNDIQNTGFFGLDMDSCEIQIRCSCLTPPDAAMNAVPFLATACVRLSHMAWAEIMTVAMGELTDDDTPCPSTNIVPTKGGIAGPNVVTPRPDTPM